MIRALILFSLFAAAGALSSKGRAEELIPADRPIEKAIDHYIGAALQAENIVPANRVNDAILLRRTTLDLVGRIPTASESRGYLESQDENKRGQAVDRLLASGGYVRHQANEFDAMLMHGSGASLRDYLKGAIGENRPWDQMFKELLLGFDSDKEQKGPIQYIRARAKDLDKLTSKVSIDFFGVNISCARCHDHPEAAEWTQAHFFGMKSFFNRTFENAGFVGEREYGLVNFKTTAGKQLNAELMFLTGKVLEEPEQKEPDAEAKKAERKKLEELKKKKLPPPPPKYSRRARLIEVALAADQSHYFAKSIVNHVWRRLIGYGLVMPVDQMHPENPPSHPELMEWLARDLRAHKYDLRRLIRGIVLSDVYARSSLWESESPRPAAESFGVGFVRPLSPHQYAASLKLASCKPDQFKADLTVEEFEKRIEQVENSSRGFASLIEQPGEGFQVSVTEALMFSNGDRVRKEFLRDADDSLLSHLRKIDDDGKLIDDLFWTVYARAPDADEKKLLTAYLQKRKGDRDAACRQMLWSLLASSELRFNY